jgi:hypothetical protein
MNAHLQLEFMAVDDPRKVEPDADEHLIVDHVPDQKHTHGPAARLVLLLQTPVLFFHSSNKDSDK